MKHSTGPSRRTVVTAICLVPLAGCTRENATATVESHSALSLIFEDIENRSGGRIGVAVLDTDTGRSAGHRADERFAVCSTFKWLLAAAVLRRVESGDERLDRLITYTADDLVFYSPVTEDHTDTGMTVEALCSATVRTSDNTAANLLLDTMGGPDGFTAIVREFGDTETRLDRYEPEMNENLPGDPRDTSTPRAMLETMNRLLFGDVLSTESRELLRGWMIAASTGMRRLRAGLPDGWIAGDKTGTSSNDQSNDAAFAYPVSPEERGPLLIVSYLNVPGPTERTTDAFHAEIARAVTVEFGLA
ncbi:class A beta-lactamase [Hyphobacterium marinum]|uniref:Beta-lactamase n=1 Tax=Hyphobacterium marinum TaxID=3116574 RepID=A0ABU7M2Z1_9PROT|nr:class A beta-lactamase [Hyphobacterium sp. Y6023]MEE2567630.1 class A beta-lactamase [Hyphobacterium sp. Y6023]